MVRKLHKWLGLSIGPLVILWFVSGMVMMVADHPRSHKTPLGRLLAMAPMAGAGPMVDFAAAWAAGGLPGAPAGARLNMLMGRPAWFFRSPGLPPVVVWGDTGEKLGEVTPEAAVASASHYLGKPLDPMDVSAMDTPDQWTVGTGVSPWHWPLYRIRLNDPDRTRVYVSRRTAEVCQVVTRAKRLTSWLGSIPHWLYFTCLRQHPGPWRQAILWLSGAGTLGAMLGMGIGCWYFRWKRFGRGRHRRSSPYMGLRKLHHLLGLIFGITTITWLFSGMLSLSPFHWDSPTTPSQAEVKSLAGGDPIPSRFALHPVRAIAACRSRHTVRMATLVMLNHIPYYLCWDSPSRSSLVRADGPGHTPMPHFPAHTILEAAHNLLPPDRITAHTKLTEYDAYCADRRNQTRLPMMRIIANDPGRTHYYMDMTTGTIFKRYDRSARLNRWLYRFLHCVDTPFFIRHRLLRDSLMWITLAGGTLTAVTGIWSWVNSRKRRKRRIFG